MYKLARSLDLITKPKTDERKMKRALLFFSLTFIYTVIAGASPKNEQIAQLLGKVIDGNTGHPIAASIRFQQLPYGSVTGSYTTNGEDGNFTLHLPPSHKFQIIISAPKYNQLVDTLLVSGDVDNSLTKTYKLFARPSENELLPLHNRIFFDNGTAKINPRSTKALNELYNFLVNNKSMKIQLEGHTNKGNRKSLMELSEKRVSSVKEYLVDSGISKRRIKVKAYGGTRPLVDAYTREAQEKNRRVEVRVLKW